jgi:hypothetical protein
LHTKSASNASSEFAGVHLAIAETCRFVTGEKLPEMDSRDQLEELADVAIVMQGSSSAK